MYTFFIKMFAIEPTTKPPKAKVPRFLAAFFMALECFYGTNYGFCSNIMGKVSGVIWSSASIIIGLI